MHFAISKKSVPGFFNCEYVYIIDLLTLAYISRVVPVSFDMRYPLGISQKSVFVCDPLRFFVSPYQSKK